MCLLGIGVLASSQEAQAQQPANQQAFEDFQTAEARLDSVYHSILQAYRGDQQFIQKLRQSQEAWRAYRDAEVAMKYPPRAAIDGGSAPSHCRYRFLADLIWTRISSLKTWLRGMPADDDCRGSVRARK
jgi:uncharacterized protein YecT (DUF1311 family)